MQHVSAAFVAGALPRGSPSTRGEAAEALSFDALPTIDQLYPPPFPAKRRHIRAVSPRAASALQRDLEATPDGLERAAAALCSPQREIVLLTSNLLQLEIAANLVANAKERAADNAKLSGKAKDALAKLKTTAEKDVYRKAEDAAEVLAATGLPGDLALKYLECLDEAGETFKQNEYAPLIERLFPQVGEGEDLDE